MARGYDRVWDRSKGQRGFLPRDSCGIEELELPAGEVHSRTEGDEGELGFTS